MGERWLIFANGTQVCLVPFNQKKTKKNMTQSNWKQEKLKYTRCTASNIPDVSSRLFYKFAHTIRDKYLAPCTLKEVKGNKLLVEIPEGSNGTMEAPINDFFFLNGC